MMHHYLLTIYVKCYDKRLWINNIGTEKWFDPVLQVLFIDEEIALLIQSRMDCR